MIALLVHWLQFRGHAFGPVGQDTFGCACGAAGAPFRVHMRRLAYSGRWTPLRGVYAAYDAVLWGGPRPSSWRMGYYGAPPEPGAVATLVVTLLALIALPLVALYYALSLGWLVLADATAGEAR